MKLHDSYTFRDQWMHSSALLLPQSLAIFAPEVTGQIAVHRQTGACSHPALITSAAGACKPHAKNPLRHHARHCHNHWVVAQIPDIL